jgi:hypothetical protein
LEPADCQAALRSAVQVAQYLAQFRRSRCGQTAPGPRRHYELLLALATELEQSVPGCNPALIFWACRRLEMEWDR